VHATSSTCLGAGDPSSGRTDGTGDLQQSRSRGRAHTEAKQLEPLREQGGAGRPGVAGSVSNEAIEHVRLAHGTKIGEGPRHAATALFHERAFGLTIIPRMTAAKTLELLNPKVPGLFYEQ
jgi:hypothetical protein